MTRTLWVFGYGSLLWSPGFTFSASQKGTIRGFSRRFYQGNVTHRGVPGKPGRVATLVEEKDGEVWGVAYAVISPNALPYLDKRECQLGGYTTVVSTFYPSCGEEPFPVLIYLATRDSSHWLGQAPDPIIAQQIICASGPSGHNVEYLLRLAEYMRSHAPEVEDSHLFRLEALVREGLKERGLAPEELVGPSMPDPRPTLAPELHDQEESPRTHQTFAASCLSKKLRCLNI